MAKVTYAGPHDAVEIDLPDGMVLVVERGETVEVDDELGARLLDQEVWQAPEEKQRKRKDGE